MPSDPPSPLESVATRSRRVGRSASGQALFERWFPRLYQQRFTILLVSLAAVLFVPPLDSAANRAAHLGRSGLISSLAFMATLLTAVLAVTNRWRTFAFFIVMSSAYLVSTTWFLIHPGRTPLLLSTILAVIILGTTLGLVSLYLFRCRQVDISLVRLAICLYLLLGVFFTSLYLLTEVLAPGSFRLGLNTQHHLWSLSYWLQLHKQLSYFSFVTLTTLGYGDITPANETAGTLAVAEAMVGQLFIAVVLARTVTLQPTK